MCRTPECQTQQYVGVDRRGEHHSELARQPGSGWWPEAGLDATRQRGFYVRAAAPQSDGLDASGFERIAGLTCDRAAARRSGAHVLIPRRVVEYDAVDVRSQSAVVFEREIGEAALGRCLVDRL